ncbi:protein BPS1, chloroplastic-like isoform X2 [Nicotiana tabacum]|uniref:Protein BPS1, chloroplastic-like n=2 Tax=Nicotiana tabacum TaxID=4097 RepID=A0A1S4BTV9_TOBAC|nr:PREDICTED: protein BPS1, chloroplastic-like [Nicotiana tabacum]
MSRPQEPHRPFLPFGNPFKFILPKGSYLSPKLLALLNAFEESLAVRVKNLKPGDKEDILTLSWMTQAISVLCAIHTDVKTLITELEFPVCDWDEKWIDVYLDNSVKLLDTCIAFSSDISRLGQGRLYLQCGLHNLDGTSKQFMKACSSLDGWKQHINSKNPRLENCFAILDSLTESLNLPKIKNSARGKVLMRAMYGVRVVTVFIFSMFAVTFSGSTKKLKDLQVHETCLWTEAFVDLRDFISGEIRSIYSNGRLTALKELEAVDTSVKKLYPIIEDGVDPNEAEQLQLLTSGLSEKAEKLSVGLDLLAKEADRFFQILLTGRDSLLCNLRVGSTVSNQAQANTNVERTEVR